jgi:hypothetical protein
MPRLPSLLSPSDHDLLRQVIGRVLQQDTNLANRVGGPDNAGPHAYLPHGFFRFKNTASETAPRGAVMRITTGSSYDDAYIAIAKPDTSFQRLYLVNVWNDVPQDKFGIASFLTGEQFSTKTHTVLYDTGNTPAYGESWGPQNGTWTIKQHRPGFLVMGGNTGTGATSRTIAVQQMTDLVIGKADAAITEDASGTVRVYVGTPGSETDSGLTIASCFNKGPALADEAWVSVGWMNGKPYCAALKCA